MVGVCARERGHLSKAVERGRCRPSLGDGSGPLVGAEGALAQPRG